MQFVKTTVDLLLGFHMRSFFLGLCPLVSKSAWFEVLIRFVVFLSCPSGSLHCFSALPSPSALHRTTKGLQAIRNAMGPWNKEWVPVGDDTALCRESPLHCGLPGYSRETVKG